MLRASRWVLFIACMSCAAGCGEPKSSTVHGTVLMDGHPLADAEVQLVPKSDAALGAHTTTTGPDGKFTIQTGGRNAPLRPGSYVVVVNKWRAGDPSKGGGGMEGMKSEVPEVYRTQAVTPLKAEIADGESTLEPFQLKAKAPMPAVDSNQQMQMK